MSTVHGMRSALAGFMRTGNPITPFYENIEGGTVAYNGSHYTLILESSIDPPRYPGHEATLLCESQTKRVWRLDYCIKAHISRSNQRASVATVSL